MTPHSRPRRWLRAATQAMTSSRVGQPVMVRLAHRADKVTLRLSRGRYSLTSLLTAQPLITLTTVGAKSGEARSVPLLGFPDGESIILIASSWGQTRHPAWYHNLRAHPEATVTRDGQSRVYTAEELTGEARERGWALAAQRYPGYAAYKKRAGGRTIPVLRLTPKHVPGA